MLNQARAWIGALTDIGLSLIALGIVLGVLIGNTLENWCGWWTYNCICTNKQDWIRWTPSCS